LKQQLFPLFWNFRKAVVSLNENSGKTADLEVYISVVCDLCYTRLLENVMKPHVAQCFLPKPNDTYVNIIRLFILKTSDITYLMSATMTKPTAGQADTLEVLSVCRQVTHIRYCLIPRYAEGKHGSPSLWELRFAAAQDIKTHSLHLPSCEPIAACLIFLIAPTISSPFLPFHISSHSTVSHPRFSPCFHGIFWHLLKPCLQGILIYTNVRFFHMKYPRASQRIH